MSSLIPSRILQFTSVVQVEKTEFNISRTWLLDLDVSCIVTRVEPNYISKIQVPLFYFQGPPGPPGPPVSFVRALITIGQTIIFL